MSVCNFVFLIATFTRLLHGHPLGIRANEHWSCEGCHNLNHDNPVGIAQLYGTIRYFIQKEQRNAYFGLNMGWMDKVLLPESRVKVTVVKPERLASLIMSTPSPLPETENDETFQLLFIELPAIKSNMVDPVGSFSSVATDKFLEANPCWMPLHEPTISNSTNYDVVTRANLLRTKNHLKSNNLYHLRTMFVTYQRTLIFIRLPIFGFHATCRLFSEITRLQHPQKCIYNNNHMMVHHLHNTGWSATFNALLFKLAEILNQRTYPNKIIVVPQAIPFRSRIRTLVDRNGTRFETAHGWYWVEPSTCPPLIEAYDPWACNFISITNCEHSFPTFVFSFSSFLLCSRHTYNSLPILLPIPK